MQIKNISIKADLEPIVMILNRALKNYPLQNHIGTFERRPEICKYISYISNYLKVLISLTVPQFESCNDLVTFSQK